MAWLNAIYPYIPGRPAYWVGRAQGWVEVRCKFVVWPLAAVLAVPAQAQYMPPGFIPAEFQMRASLGRQLWPAELQRCREEDARILREHWQRQQVERERAKRRDKNADLRAEWRLGAEEGFVADLVTGPPPEPPRPSLTAQLQTLHWGYYATGAVGLVLLCRPRRQKEADPC